MGLFSRNSSGSAVTVEPVKAEAFAAPEPVVAAPRGISGARASVLQPVAPVVRGEREIYFEKMKVRIHQQLVDRLEVQNLKTLPADFVRQEVRALIRELCETEKGLLNSSDQERLMDDVMDETFGLGPLDALLKDPAITDILVNRFDRVYVERRGRLELSDVRFRDNQHLRQIIDRIGAVVGGRIDERSPMAEARLGGGSR